MRKSHWIVVGLILALVLGAFAVACGEDDATTTTGGSETTAGGTETTAGGTETTAGAAKTLTIGVPIGLTGWISAQDIVAAEELRIAAALINEDGGITVGGQPYTIELVLEDTQSDFDGCAAAVNKLIFDNKVQYIVGANAMFNTVVSPICNQNKVLQSAAYSVLQPGEVDATTPYTFLTCNGFVGRSMASIASLKEYYPDAKNVAVVLVDDGGIPYMTPIVKNFLAAQDVTIAGDSIIGFANELQDFSPIGAKLNAIGEVDAVLHITGIISHVASLVKSYRELGNEEVPYVTALLANCGDIYNVAGGIAADGIFSNAATPGDPENPPMMAELIKRLQAKLGEDTAVYLEYANSLIVLVNAIEMAQSLDPTEIAAFWETEIDTIETLFGTGRMGGEQTHGIANHAVAHPMCMQMMKDGQQVAAGWVDIGQIP
ncbi:MAG: ABC transporter substrate-binding protein [Actinobacteria bacterium]|jgi:ABC-type branched-subunit amino acid transport system substrate-binding protein|nr:ABC transporter substrate-binding protein [Actinomycetota bacterium]